MPHGAPAPSELGEAAELAGLDYGSVWEAMQRLDTSLSLLTNGDDGIVCSERRGCIAVGEVRGMVHVWGLEATGADRAVVTLRVLTVQDTPGVLYEQVDEIHVARQEHGTGWRITRVVHVSQS